MRYPLLPGAVLTVAGFLAVGSFAVIQNLKVDKTKPIQNQSIIKSADDNPSSGPTAVLANQPEAVPKPLLVTVEAGDTLSAIAAENGTTFGRVYDANPELADPHVLKAGQQLRIPAADEQLAGRPLPEPVEPVAAPMAVAAPAPAPVSVAPAPAPVATGSVWDRLAQCESTGNWAINTGNGYYGGLQFSLSSWQGVGGTGYPHQNSREEQIARAEILLSRGGWGHWPACAKKLGLL